MKAIFAHKQTYSRKGNSKSRSLADICAEVARTKGAIPHVKAPLPPNVLDGIDPADIPEIIDSRVKAQNSALRKLRKEEPDNAKHLRAVRVDTHLLVASIFSYPQSCEELEHDDFTEYNRWVKDVIAFAHDDAEANGLEIMSAVEHLDEAHPQTPGQIRLYGLRVLFIGSLCGTLFLNLSILSPWIGWSVVVITVGLVVGLFVYASSEPRWYR